MVMVFSSLKKNVLKQVFKKIFFIKNVKTENYCNLIAQAIELL